VPSSKDKKSWQRGACRAGQSQPGAQLVSDVAEMRGQLCVPDAIPNPQTQDLLPVRTTTATTPVKGASTGNMRSPLTLPLHPKPAQPCRERGRLRRTVVSHWGLRYVGPPGVINSPRRALEPFARLRVGGLQPASDRGPHPLRTLCGWPSSAADLVPRRQLVDTVEDTERLGFLGSPIPHQPRRPVRRARRNGRLALPRVPASTPRSPVPDCRGGSRRCATRWP
jgi:hypothetical protein